MKLLVTGGGGYLGARFTRLASATAAHEILVSTRSDAANVAAPPGVRVVQADPADPDAMARVCAGVDVIVHLAGMNAAASARDPAAAIAARAHAADALLAAATRQGVARVVCVSSIHVYGAALHGLVDEGTVAEPQHPYAVAHRAAELRFQDALAAASIEVIVARLSNAFGAPANGAGDCWTLATNALCRQAVQTRRVVLETTGTQRRDFIPISEACRALLHLGLGPRAATADGLINVGGGAARTLLEQADLIAAAVETELGFRPQVQRGARSDAVGGDFLGLSSARLQAAGFEPDPRATARELAELVRHCAGMQVAA